MQHPPADRVPEASTRSRLLRVRPACGLVLAGPLVMPPITTLGAVPDHRAGVAGAGDQDCAVAQRNGVDVHHPVVDDDSHRESPSQAVGSNPNARDGAEVAGEGAQQPRAARHRCPATAATTHHRGRLRAHSVVSSRSSAQPGRTGQMPGNRKALPVPPHTSTPPDQPGAVLERLRAGNRQFKQALASHPAVDQAIGIRVVLGRYGSRTASPSCAWSPRAPTHSCPPSRNTS